MEFQPALGISQLKKADAIFQARQRNVRALNEIIGPFSEFLVLPSFDECVSYLAYPLVVREGTGVRR
jgi:dTDP-4-amino-4,6-dideoxygalactose transaminase